MKEAGIHLEVSFDENAPKILAVSRSICLRHSKVKTIRLYDFMHSDVPDSWRFRHLDRFPKAYMNWECYWVLKNIP